MTLVLVCKNYQLVTDSVLHPLFIEQYEKEREREVGEKRKREKKKKYLKHIMPEEMMTNGADVHRVW